MRLLVGVLRELTQLTRLDVHEPTERLKRAELPGFVGAPSAPVSLEELALHRLEVRRWVCLVRWGWVLRLACWRWR